MGTRRNLGGRYVNVRERNTSKGNRGTIMSNWTSKQKSVPKNKTQYILWAVIVLILIILIYIIYNFIF